MARQPACGRHDPWIAGRPANRKQRQNAIGGGGAVAAEMRAVVAGFVGVKLGGREEEAAIAIVRAPRIVVLAALYEHARALENRVGIRYSGGAQRVENMPGHGQVHVPGNRFGAPFAAHAPRPVHRVQTIPAVLLRELLDAQIRGHGTDLLFPPWAACPAERAHGESRRVIGVVRNARIVHSERAIGTRVVPDKRDGPANFRARQRVDLFWHFE